MDFEITNYTTEELHTLIGLEDNDNPTEEEVLEAVNTKIKNSSSLDKIFNAIKNISLIDNYVVQELNNNSAKIGVFITLKLSILTVPIIV